MKGAWLLLALAVGQAPASPHTVEAPRLEVDTSWPQTPGRRIHVADGGDLQAALDSARPGDLVEIKAGAVFRGPFTLPAKESSDWILVRSDAPDGDLPPAGERATPAAAAHMPRLVSESHSVITAAPGAHHYRFVGLEIAPSPGRALTALVQLGGSETSIDQIPHHIIFDRCYLHGDPARGTRRGIALNSAYTAVIDSYLSDFKEVGADSQALAGWAGPGPFRIADNYLEGAGENLMFGGADPPIRDLVPSDIVVVRNHFAKPLSWRIGDPGYAGTAWTVKNLFELKNARRVRIEGNLFENSWPHAQNGFAILFTVRNQDGTAPWSCVEDVTFADNIVRRSAAGVNLLGRDDGHPSSTGRTRRILIRNNVFDSIGGDAWGGSGILFQILGGTEDVVIENNTASQTGSVIMAEGPPHTGFVFRGNVAPHNAYGVTGTGTGVGRQTLAAYFPGAQFEANCLAGGKAGDYPSGNQFPASIEAARRRSGADLATICAALAPSDRPRDACQGAPATSSR